MYLLLILFYFVGVFPTGYLLARAKGIDITSIGSGNVGATNVARALGKRAGLLTLLIDLLKGATPVAIAYLITDDKNFIYLSGLMPVLGHCFSIPGFLKGGKGVATGLGASLCIAPLATLIAVIVFIVSYKISKIVSLSSVIATVVLPLANFALTSNASQSCILMIIASVIIFKHRENIKRLAQGEEKKFKA